MIFMKTYCKPKHIHITDPDFNRPAVHDAFGNGKLRRFDFRRYLVQVGGISFETLNGERLAHRCNHIVDAIDKVCDDMTQRIRDLSARLAQLGAADTGRDEIEAADELFRRLISCDEQPERSTYEA